MLLETSRKVHFYTAQKPGQDLMRALISVNMQRPSGFFSWERGCGMKQEAWSYKRTEKKKHASFEEGEDMKGVLKERCFGVKTFRHFSLSILTLKHKQSVK